ncbi:hypothetical protein [Actinoplanes sp. NPDC026670]|uniref:hypothetical protein n=1 Tax=Actinoplanes sp. NPDC026670 TaxID=3154700 RepID=UPI0033D44D25
MAEQISGDWEAVARAGDALGKLAEFNERYAETIGQGAATMIPAGWDGNAAVRAEVYFSRLTRALTAQVDSIRSTSGQFRTLAAGMKELAQAIQSLCQDIADALITLTRAVEGERMRAGTPGTNPFTVPEPAIVTGSWLRSSRICTPHDDDAVRAGLVS